MAIPNSKTRKTRKGKEKDIFSDMLWETSPRINPLKIATNKNNLIVTKNRKTSPICSLRCLNTSVNKNRITLVLIPWKRYSFSKLKKTDVSSKKKRCVKYIPTETNTININSFIFLPFYLTEPPIGKYLKKQRKW